jgi:hypothetical protein
LKTENVAGLIDQLRGGRRCRNREGRRGDDREDDRRAGVLETIK